MLFWSWILQQQTIHTNLWGQNVSIWFMLWLQRTNESQQKQYIDNSTDSAFIIQTETLENLVALRSATDKKAELLIKVLNWHVKISKHFFKKFLRGDESLYDPEHKGQSNQWLPGGRIDLIKAKGIGQQQDHDNKAFWILSHSLVDFLDSQRMVISTYGKSVLTSKWGFSREQLGKVQQSLPQSQQSSQSSLNKGTLRKSSWDNLRHPHDRSDVAAFGCFQFPYII